MRIFSFHRWKLGAGCLLLSLCLVIAGCTRKGGPSAGLGSAEALAPQVPKGVHAALIFDLNGHVDWPGWARDVDELLKAGPRGNDFEEEVGMSPEQWVKLFNGKGYVAVLDSASADAPGAIACFGLADGAAFDAWWKKQADSYPDKGEEKTIEGVPFRVFSGDDGYVGHDAQWLYIAANESDAKTLVTSVAKKGEGLDKNALFADGLKQVGIRSAGSIWFTNIKGLVGKAQEAQLPYTDATTYTELGALEYAILTADFESKKFEGFLKVSGESNLAKQLLTKGQIKGESLKALSGSVTSSNTLDAEWTVNTLIKLGMVLTQSRQYAGMASIGLMSQGDPWKAFQGEFTGAGNLWEVSAPMLTSNFGTARARGQATACKSNLKNIGTALEMYSTDYSGRYPASAAMLTPNYLKTIPNCPAAGKDTYSETLKVTASPDTYQFHCAGHHHSMLQADHPKYNSQEGLVSGPESMTQEDPPPDPSHAIAIVLEDAEAAKAFIDKIMPLDGEVPKEGESTEFPLPMPDSSLEMSRKGTPMLKLAVGPDSKNLVKFDGPSLAENKMLKAQLKASPEGLVYLDYMNLGPAYDQVIKAIEGADADEESKAALAFAKKMKGRAGSLEGSSAVTVTATGLHYRAEGIVNGGLVMVGGVGGAILVPNFIRARSQGQSTACKSNLKNIGTALEMYSTDWSGAYPDSMAKLTPNYLRTIPDCPVAGKNTYSDSYSRIKTKEGWDSYQVFCKGANHTAVSIPADYPAYNGIVGLQERP